MGMLPGVGGRMKQELENFDEREIVRTEAIIQSMTPEERRNPKILNGSRRLRIAKGCGLTVTHVNQLVQRFEQASKMMKTVARGGTPQIPGMGAIPGMHGGRKRQQPKQKKGARRSGNPAKRAQQAQVPKEATGSGFGLGQQNAPQQPSEADLEKMQQLLRGTKLR